MSITLPYCYEADRLKRLAAAKEAANPTPMPAPVVVPPPVIPAYSGPNPLRPREWSEYIGQEHVKKVLGTSIEAALLQNRPLGHVFLSAPAGCGKTSLAEIVAHKLGDDFLSITMGTMKPAQLIRELSCFGGGVVFFDEALAIDTPIATPSGWTAMGDLKVGDQVFGPDGRPVNVTHTTPIQSGRPCFRVWTRNNATSIIADANHKWAVSINGRKTKIITTQEMHDRKARGHKIQIDPPRPLELPEVDLPIAPYLLGLWVGDGSTSQTHLNIRIGDAKPILKELHKTNPNAAYISVVSNGSIQRITLSPAKDQHGSDPSPFRCQLVDLGIWADKHIPASYLRGSVGQRLACLQGLMDSDGSVDDSGYCTFGTTIPRVAESFRELLASLGYRSTTSIGIDNRKDSYLPYHRVSFKGDPLLPPFRLKRNARLLKAPTHLKIGITKVTPVESVPVRCIAVDNPSHIFLAGHQMVPTHNCHRGTDAEQEMLLPLLDEGKITHNGRTVYLDWLTVIAATTEPRKVIAPLLSRFQLRPDFVEYSDDEMKQIVDLLCERLGVDFNDGQTEILARACGGTPRMAKQLVLTAKDIQICEWEVTAAQVLEFHKLDEDGLSHSHYEYLRAMKLAGGSAGMSTLTNLLDANEGMVRDLERLLLKKRLITFQSTGRELTSLGYKKLTETSGRRRRD